MWYEVLADFEVVFQISIVSLIGSRMSEILAVSVHSGWDERKIKDALSLKPF